MNGETRMIRQFKLMQEERRRREGENQQGLSKQEKCNTTSRLKWFLKNQLPQQGISSPASLRGRRVAAVESLNMSGWLADWRRGEEEQKYGPGSEVQAGAGG